MPRTSVKARPPYHPGRVGRARKKSFPQQVGDLIKSAGEWRDRALVIAGLFYAAGYLIWSLNALQNNLGLLPAFQLQYIVAGIGPVVIGTIAVGGGLWFWRFLTNVWLKKLGADATGLWRLIRSLFWLMAAVPLAMFVTIANPTLGLIALLLVILSLLPLLPGREDSALRKIVAKKLRFTPYEKLSPPRQRFRIVLGLMVIAGLVLVWTRSQTINAAILGPIENFIDTDTLLLYGSISLGISFVFGPPVFITGWLAKLYRAFYFLLFVVGFVFVSLIFYQERIYTQLPQELGGLKPRCAYLDMRVEGLSEETHQVIAAPVRTGADAAVVRSLQLDVLFASNSLLMVRPNPAPPGAEGVVYEISRSNVQAITWCK
jgi:hypothetical protein